MEYTSMGSRGKYSSENNLWSQPWSSSQPSTRRGSEQSVKDGSNIPRTGVILEDNTDFDKIGASIDALRRDGELSMGAPPPLGAAFSGSVSNFTHQSSSNVNQVRRRGSRRSIGEAAAPTGLNVDRTVDVNGNEGQSVSVAQSAGNLSQGFMLGGSVGSRSLHRQNSGDVHRSVAPGLSSISDVSSSAEELDSPTNAGRKGPTNKTNQDPSSLPPKFTLKQSTNDVYNATQPGISSQQDMTSSIDDKPMNSTLNLQTPQQVGVAGKEKSPLTSRSTLQTSTEAVQSRNELKMPSELSSARNLSGSTNGAPVKPPPGLSSTQNVSESTNEVHGTSSLQTPQNQQKKQKKSKSPYSSQASFKPSTEVLTSDLPSYRESESRLTPGQSSTQGSSAHVDENPRESGSASQSVLHDGRKLKSSRSSVHNSSINQVHGNEPRADTEEFGTEFGAAQTSADDPSAHVGNVEYVPSYAQPSRKDEDVREKGKGLASLGATKSMNLGPKDAERSGASGTAGPTKSSFELRSKEFSNKNGKGASRTRLSNSERIEENDSNENYSRLTDQVEQRDVKTFSPKEVETTFASLPRAAKDTNEKASGGSYQQLEGAKTFSPKEVQTSFASVVTHKPSADYRPEETNGKASGASYNQWAGKNRDPRTEEATRPAGATKVQSSGDVDDEFRELPKANVTATSYAVAPSSFVTSVLSSIKAKKKATEIRENEAAKPFAHDNAVKVEHKQKSANASLESRSAARTAVPRHSENEINWFSSNASATTSATNLNDRLGVDVKNSRPNSTSASESSLYSGPSLNASQRSIASSVVDRRADRENVGSHRLGKTVSIGGISSIGNSASNLVGGSHDAFRGDGSEISLSASKRGSRNKIRKQYGSEEVSKTATREDIGNPVEPALERSYAFALKWDPYTLRVKCEHKGEIRLAYLPIRKILDEHEESCIIIDTFQKLFSDSIHKPDVFDLSRHFLAFLDADGDWCTLGDTPEDYLVFVESSKFDPTKAASRVARLQSFDLSILEDLNRRKIIDSAEDDDESRSFGSLRRQSEGSDATSASGRSGGRKFMHGDSEDLNEILRKYDVGSSGLSEIKSTSFSFPNEAFSFQQAVFLGWLVGAAPMVVAVRHSEFWMTSGLQTEEYNREPWYDYTIFALGISMLVSFIGYVGAGTIDKQRLGLTLLCVNAISICSYLSIVAGLTPAVSDLVNRPLEIVRYLDWAFTCPTLILLTGQLTQTEENVKRAMIVNLAMIASRFIGSCLPWSYALPFSATSFGCFSFLVSDVWRWWSAAISRQKAAVGTTKGLAPLRILSTTSSVMYPIIWLLGIADVVSFEEGEVLYCVADVLAKVLFTVIAVSNCFEYPRSSTAKLESDTAVANNPSGEVNTSNSSLNSVGRKLQREPSIEMDTFDAATVFACDIVGYTSMVDRYTATNVSKTLHNLWKHLETIATVHHIYKVESKCNEFVGVAGAPDRSHNHAKEAAEFALDVLQMAKVFTTEPNKKGKREKIQLRIGFHTGPLSAGIVDHKNVRYGIFGDTVTTAGRMEATCVPMRIQVSEDTYKALERKGFEFEACNGKKVKGKEKTYFLVGKRND